VPVPVDADFLSVPICTPWTLDEHKIARIDSLGQRNFDVWLLSYLTKQPSLVLFPQESKLMGNLDNGPWPRHSAEFRPHSGCAKPTIGRHEIAAEALAVARRQVAIPQAFGAGKGSNPKRTVSKVFVWRR
jgi:hypothetical protein